MQDYDNLNFELKAASAEVSERQYTIDKFSEQIEALEAQLHESDAEIERLHEERMNRIQEVDEEALEKLNIKEDALQQQLNDKSVEVTVLQEKMEDLQRQLDILTSVSEEEAHQLRLQREEAEEALDQQRTDNEELQKRFNALSTEFETFKKQNTTSNDQIEQLQSERDAAYAQLAQLQQYYALLYSCLEAAGSAKEEIAADLTALKQHIEEARFRIEFNKKERAILLSGLAETLKRQVQGTVATLSAAMEGISVDLTALKQQIEEVRFKIVFNKEERDISLNELAEALKQHMQSSFNALKLRYEDLQRENTETNEKLKASESVRSERDSLAAQMTDLRCEYDDSRNRINDLLYQLNTMQQEAKSKEELSSLLQQERDELGKRLEASSEQVNVLQSEATALQEVVAEKDNRILALERELSDTKVSLESVQQSSSDSDDLIRTIEEVC